jgi:hypothetical protein
VGALDISAECLLAILGLLLSSRERWLAVRNLLVTGRIATDGGLVIVLASAPIRWAFVEFIHANALDGWMRLLALRVWPFFLRLSKVVVCWSLTRYLHTKFSFGFRAGVFSFTKSHAACRTLGSLHSDKCGGSAEICWCCVYLDFLGLDWRLVRDL